MSAHLNKLWYEKHRPSDTTQYIFQSDQQRDQIQSWIQDKSIPHLLLSGGPGVGKTSLANVLINELDVNDVDLLEINASDQNSVEFMRETLNNFVKSFPLGDFKLVHLKEADYLSQPAQGILRVIMEEYEEQCRFILTCNHEYKIKPAIKSRCTILHFKSPNHDDIAVRLVEILVAENISPDLDLIDSYIAASYPDIRKIINSIEKNTIDGKLLPPDETGTDDYKLILLDLIKSDDWSRARTVVCPNVTNEEWDDVYRFLYENLHKSAKFSNNDSYESGIVTIAEHLYKHSIVADPEINAASLFIMLNQI